MCGFNVNLPFVQLVAFSHKEFLRNPDFQSHCKKMFKMGVPACCGFYKSSKSFFRKVSFNFPFIVGEFFKVCCTIRAVAGNCLQRLIANDERHYSTEICWSSTRVEKVMRIWSKTIMDRNLVCFMSQLPFAINYHPNGSIKITTERIKSE